MWAGSVFKHFGSILTELCTQVLEHKISFEFANRPKRLTVIATKRLKRFKNNFSYKFLGVKLRSTSFEPFKNGGQLKFWWTKHLERQTIFENQSNKQKLIKKYHINILYTWLYLIIISYKLTIFEEICKNCIVCPSYFTIILSYWTNSHAGS